MASIAAAKVPRMAGMSAVWAWRTFDAKLLTLYSANQREHSMSIGTILMIVALIAAVLVLAIGLRPPPLYGPPEKDDKAEGEPPDSQKPH
jgi:hypothetical protein